MKIKNLLFNLNNLVNNDRNNNMTQVFKKNSFRL